MSYETRYAHAKRAQRDALDSTPEAAEHRRQMRVAGEQAHAETLAKFGKITVDNADAVLAFQAQRYNEILAHLLKNGR